MVCRRSLAVPAVGQKSLGVCVCVCVCSSRSSRIKHSSENKEALKMTSGILPLPWVYPKDLVSLPESGLKNMGKIPTIQLEMVWGS